MESNFHKYLVPGLDVFVSDPEILNPFEETKRRADFLYIPKEYVDRAADFEGEQSARGDACGVLLDYFIFINQKINHSDQDFFELPNGTKVFLVEPKNYFGFDPKDFMTSSKRQAISLARHLVEEKIASASEVAIYTGSRKLAGPASVRNIDVAQVNPEVYTGRRRVKLPFELSHLWFSNHRVSKNEWEDFFPDEAPLKINEFIEFVSDSPILTGNRLDSIGRFDAEENALIPLRYKALTTNKNPARIFPRNPGQAMLVEALQTPPTILPMVVCLGIYGTGKTFLATGAGYLGTLSEDYDHVFVCPRDGALGAEIGFVPGDTTEKTRVKARPIEDNLREILKIMNHDQKKRGTALKSQVEQTLKEYFEFEPLINMGGRSLSDMFLIFDEFQDTERYQATALLSRLGNNTKAIALGDPFQTTNPHLGPTSNGLSYSASRLAGKPEAAVITLFPEEIERSDATRAIASYFTSPRS